MGIEPTAPRIVRSVIKLLVHTIGGRSGGSGGVVAVTLTQQVHQRVAEHQWHPQLFT